MMILKLSGISNTVRIVHEELLPLTTYNRAPVRSASMCMWVARVHFMLSSAADIHCMEYMKCLHESPISLVSSHLTGSLTIEEELSSSVYPMPRAPSSTTLTAAFTNTVHTENIALSTGIHLNSTHLLSNSSYKYLMETMMANLIIELSIYRIDPSLLGTNRIKHPRETEEVLIGSRAQPETQLATLFTLTICH